METGNIGAARAASVAQIFQDYPARWLALAVSILNLANQLAWINLTQAQGDAILQVVAIVIVIVAGFQPATSQPPQDSPRIHHREQQ